MFVIVCHLLFSPLFFVVVATHLWLFGFLSFLYNVSSERLYSAGLLPRVSSAVSLDTTPSRSDDSRESSGRLEMRTNSLPNGDANKVERDESPMKYNGRKMQVADPMEPIPSDSIC
jgi:hypothetical protein